MRAWETGKAVQSSCLLSVASAQAGWAVLADHQREVESMSSPAASTSRLELTTVRDPGRHDWVIPATPHLRGDPWLRRDYASTCGKVTRPCVCRAGPEGWRVHAH